VLVLQNDGFLINSTNFGYLYTITFPLIILGAYFFLTSPHNLTEAKLLWMWLISSLAIGVFVEATFNRINLVFIPLFVLCAGFLEWLNKKKQNHIHLFDSRISSRLFKFYILLSQF